MFRTTTGHSPAINRRTLLTAWLECAIQLCQKITFELIKTSRVIKCFTLHFSETKHCVHGAISESVSKFTRDLTLLILNKEFSGIYSSDVTYFIGCTVASSRVRGGSVGMGNLAKLILLGAVFAAFQFQKIGLGIPRSIPLRAVPPENVPHVTALPPGLPVDVTPHVTVLYKDILKGSGGTLGHLTCLYNGLRGPCPFALCFCVCRHVCVSVCARACAG